MHLLILACSRTKRLDDAPLSALDRYDGPTWRVLRAAYARDPGLSSRLAVFALSAQYGLISAYTIIPVYDRLMDAARATELQPKVAGTLATIGPFWESVYVGVGPAYRAALPDPLPWPATMGEGAIGKRLHDLKEWLCTR